MEAVGISTAGGISSADIAMACANCDDIGFLAIKRRILDDKAICSGYYRLYTKVVKIAQKERWKHKTKAIKAGEIRKLLDVCLDDYFKMYQCDKCGGTGVMPLIEGNDVITGTCNKCLGKKLRERFDYERCKIFGISSAGYSKHWKKKHVQVMGMLRDVIPNKESQAEYEIKRLMRQS